MFHVDKMRTSVPSHCKISLQYDLDNSFISSLKTQSENKKHAFI